MKTHKYKIGDIVKIKKTLLSDKIIFRDTGKSLVIDYEVQTMGKQAPEWFKEWTESEFKPFKEQVLSDIATIKSCPTIARELKSNKDV